MFQFIPFAVALLGSSIAAAWDLRTTEIPDEIPYVMTAVALLFYGVQSFLSGSYWPITNSVIVGSALFGFGFGMYYLGQWGGGDAKLLAAIGFLLPTASAVPVLNGTALSLIFPFPVSYLFNVFFVGAVYMLAYAAYLALDNKKIISEFKRDVKASIKMLLVFAGTLLLLSFGVNLVLYSYFQIQPQVSPIFFNSLSIAAGTLVIFLIWRFARVVENVGLKKKIPVSKLRVGDVLLSSKLWEGITEKELKRIKRSGKRYVQTKEGVRFGPAFPIALLFTIYYGDTILFLIRAMG